MKSSLAQVVGVVGLAFAMLAVPLLTLVVLIHPRAASAYLVPRDGSLWWTALTAVFTVVVAALGVLDG